MADEKQTADAETSAGTGEHICLIRIGQLFQGTEYRYLIDKLVELGAEFGHRVDNLWVTWDNRAGHHTVGWLVRDQHLQPSNSAELFSGYIRVSAAEAHGAGLHGGQTIVQLAEIWSEQLPPIVQQPTEPAPYLRSTDPVARRLRRIVHLDKDDDRSSAPLPREVSQEELYAEPVGVWVTAHDIVVTPMIRDRLHGALLSDAQQLQKDRPATPLPRRTNEQASDNDLALIGALAADVTSGTRHLNGKNNPNISELIKSVVKRSHDKPTKDVSRKASARLQKRVVLASKVLSEQSEPTVVLILIGVLVKLTTGVPPASGPLKGKLFSDIATLAAAECGRLGVDSRDSAYSSLLSLLNQAPPPRHK